MMVLKRRTACGGCYKPPERRLASFEPQGQYQCYAESYVKCFWGLCDQHKSVDDFAPKAKNNVVTQQPRQQELPFKNNAMAKDIFVLN